MLEERHAIEDDSAVHLELRFARSTESHGAFSAATARTAALAFEVGPETLQTREHIAILRQFHLCFGIGRLGAHGEDVEDEGGAVEDFHFQFALNVAQLLGGEFIVEDDHTHFALSVFLCHDVLPNFVEFAFSDVSHRTRSVEALRKALDGDSSGGLRQKLQFVEIFCRLSLVLRLRDEGHEDGGFGFGFRLYEFFHD